MRIAETVIEGIFLRRDNRFRVTVEVEGKEHAAHLPNSGRLGELLLPGKPAALVPRSIEGRRTKFDMVQVFAKRSWISTDSRLPNRLVAEALEKKELPALGDFDTWKSEPRIDEGRLDFLFESEQKKTFIEVKSVTLVNDRVAKFPDAPTERGAKHVRALARLARQGHDSVVLFVVQREDADSFTPHASNDPPFAEACRYAAEAGVRFIAYRCRTKLGEIVLADQIPVRLN